MIIAGFMGVVYSVAIYYLLPYSLLNLDLSLILTIFFAILIGMIFGLTLLAYNFERLLEEAIVKILLFFEHKSMKIMILKNLVAHKAKNELTAIIQTLTLACIVFLITMLNLELLQFTSGDDLNTNFDIVLSQSYLDPEVIEPVLL
jgi:hypothetical protein